MLRINYVRVVAAALVSSTLLTLISSPSARAAFLFENFDCNSSTPITLNVTQGDNIGFMLGFNCDLRRTLYVDSWNRTVFMFANGSLGSAIVSVSESVAPGTYTNALQLRYTDTTSYTFIVSASTSAPLAPTLNSVTGGDKQLSIAFTAGAENGAELTDYEYSLNGGSYISAGTTTSPITITGLSGRTSYSVTIKSRNSAGLSIASSSLSATTTDATLDATEAAAEAARIAAASAAEAARIAEAARVAAVAAEAARVAEAATAQKAKEQRELTAILSVIPSIAGLSQSIGELTNSIFVKQKCVKGKSIVHVKKGTSCPKSYVKKK